MARRARLCHASVTASFEAVLTVTSPCLQLLLPAGQRVEYKYVILEEQVSSAARLAYVLSVRALLDGSHQKLVSCGSAGLDKD